MKRILSLIALVALTFNIQAVSVTATVAGNSKTNILALMPSGIAKVTSLSTANNGAAVQTLSFYDSPDGSYFFTNAAYITTSSYPSNYSVFYTNYFGVVQGITNIMLVDVTNTVAATTQINWPVRAVTVLPASTTTTMYPVNYLFDAGVWVTNSGANSVTITINAYTY